MAAPRRRPYTIGSPMRSKFQAYAALRLLCIVLACAAAVPARAQAQEIPVPAWFKVSFLDLRDDVKEATAAGRRVMIYFGQNGCPYCKQLMEVNFRERDIMDMMRRHFDAIELNIFGSREVTWLDGKERTEKEFASALKVQFTPTLVFLDEKGGVALRMNGYYPPRRFLTALEYVAGHNENKVSFAEFQKNSARGSASATLHDEPFFHGAPYTFDRRTPAARPLAVFFEQPDCLDCDELHAGPLAADATRKLLSRFDAYRLDVRSSAPVVAPDGAQTTAAAWARTLNVSYTPSIVFFDGTGREVLRIESYVRSFHLQAALDYVSSSAYLQEPSFQRFVQARADAIRARGGRVELMR